MEYAVSMEYFFIIIEMYTCKVVDTASSQIKLRIKNMGLFFELGVDDRIRNCENYSYSKGVSGPILKKTIFF